ncbi:putative DNA-directed RNA polymerase alpha chain [Neospora caninum Liverpool]|nr:putative DNA-directed RNA polymerase alpha chain [Neospora caninum Liverpool]CBZ56146.1 putative DNA-directed RNA polymerase alpha chain [Neospora caninum Liverpool]|eukprot:XP_003886172.1 putative DNA-directed RNA polymerase alpha chain [Neospora caninum Liverpool]
MRDGEDKASEEERIRRKAQAWRVDRSVLELSPEELDQKIRDEKEEIHQRWRTRLDVEQRRHQDYFEQQREDQRELLKSLPAPPWVYLFRPVQLDESPPLKYDFRVYQPYFQSLIEASRPFIHTKIVPPSAIQRFLERRHSLDSSLSSGFRFKQIQPLFAHNSGCSAFFYFHTCFSSLAPAFLNALRRTSLSRIESLAVAAVKIEGAKHEFYSLPGIREDIVDDIFNNLGKIVFREKKVVYVHRKDIRAWLANRQRDKERMGDGMAGEKAEKEERPEAKEETAVRLPVRTGADEATETADKGGQTTEKERGDMPAGLEKESKTSQAEAGGVWNLLPPGTTLVRTRPRENAEKGWASWLQPSALSSGEDTEDDMYYRIPLPLPPANFTHPLRAKLRVRGPLVAVAGHIQLPEGVEVVNKNQYLFTVNSGYYVNMDFKIERIREYVMPEFGYDSLERDRDEEGFMYFTNHVAPVPIFAYAAERRGEAVHTKWDEVNENAPPGEEVEPEEDEEEAAVMTQVEDMLRQATAGAPDVVKASLSPLVQGREAAEKEEGTGEAVERERQEGNEGSGGQDREQQGERAQALIVEESRDKGDGAEENEKGAVAQDRRPSSSLSFDSMKPEDRYNAYRLLEPSEEMRAAYRRDYLENDLPYQNLGEVVTLEVQTDGSLTPREALLHCCDDLIKQVLDIQHALYHNCHVGVDGTEEEEFDDPDWYQDAHRYVGVPWNPYKGSAARSQKRQDFFFKTDVLRQYNILREKMDARREAFAEASSGEEGETQATKPRIWPVPGRGIRSDVFVATSPAEEEMMKGDILREKEEAVYRELEFQRNRLQDTPEGVGPRSGPTYGLSEHDLAERLLDEEEEEERIVNTSAIIRKEREEAWKDKQRTYRDLAENEPLKQLGDGKGLVKYPPDTKPMMEAPEWVMEDPMGQRKPIGFSEFNDD